jgi:hypothetical protein
MAILLGWLSGWRWEVHTEYVGEIGLNEANEALAMAPMPIQQSNVSRTGVDPMVKRVVAYMRVSKDEP